MSNAVPSASYCSVAHDFTAYLNEAGYCVGPTVSLIWYVIFAAAFCTDAEVSVFDVFKEFFTAWMNMSAAKYPAASASEPLVPGLNAWIWSFIFLIPGEV